MNGHFGEEGKDDKTLKGVMISVVNKSRKFVAYLIFVFGQECFSLVCIGYNIYKLFNWSCMTLQKLTFLFWRICNFQNILRNSMKSGNTSSCVACMENKRCGSSQSC